MYILFLLSLLLVPSPQILAVASKNGSSHHKTKSYSGGISLSSDGHLYEVTTEECPGGIFFPQAVNETCLCYNGIFAIVRDCCSEEDGLIGTDTLEWRKNYQCGVSPEIGNPGSKPIRAILPLTKGSKPFRPVMTLQEFSGQSFSKWRKFDLITLSKAPEPTVLVNSTTVEIINVRVLPQEVRFRMGTFGDVDICYSGWYPVKSQTLRISVKEYSTISNTEKYCCFKIHQSNSPGVITSPCRGGSVVTEIVEIESVNRGNACPNQGRSARAMFLSKAGRKTKPPKDLIRFKRSGSGSKTERKKRQAPPSDDDLTIIDEKYRFPLEQLASKDNYLEELSLRLFTFKRKSGDSLAIGKEYTQRFLLLKKSMEIFHTIVPEVMVPKQFVEDGFEAFHYLYEFLDTDEGRMTEEQFQRTLDVLGNCTVNVKPWGDTPVELIYADGSCPLELAEVIITDSNGTRSDSHSVPVPPDWLQVDKVKYDLFVEIAWKLTDWVHSMCFDDFFDDYNAHHFYATQLEMLFLSSYVQDRWYRSESDYDDPINYKPNLNYANKIIQGPNKESRMKEMDKAVGIAHTLSRYKDYLHRPNKDHIIEDSVKFRQVQLFEAAVAARLQSSRRSRLQEYDGEEYSDSPDANVNDVDPPLVSHEMLGRNDHDRPLQENGEDAGSVRSKKHIGNDDRKGRNMLNRNSKPGDTIWNGLAVCLGASSNDNPGYYTQEELWGTKPSLSELGEKYPLKATSM